jgi:deoxyribonuclease-1
MNFEKIELQSIPSFEKDTKYVTLDPEYTPITQPPIHPSKNKLSTFMFSFCLCFMTLFILSIIILIFIFSVTFNNSFNEDTNKLNVVAWNLKDFGNTKLSDDRTLILIQQIISSYDVILLMELEQSSCDTDDQCDMKVKFGEDFPEHNFYMTASLGRNEHNNRGKEQYGFLIKKNLQISIQSYANPNSIFARPPYYVTINDFNIHLAVVHISATPHSTSFQEVVELDSFFRSVDGDMILMGDLNICEPSELNGQAIRENYEWLLKDFRTTNIADTCAYDRIITRKSFGRYSNPDVLKYEINNLISDHYPITIVIKK